MGRICATAALAFAAMAAVFVGSASACGPDADCVLGERSYRVYLPAEHDAKTPLPAILYAHGYRGSATGVMRNQAMRRLADRLGVALIAANAARDDWDIPNTPAKMDADGQAELAYFAAVADDAAKRFAIDRERIMVSGFSAGGMMTWEIICGLSQEFAAFAPVAGVFWAPEPDICRSPPANVIHIHGTADRVVPLAGRPIGQTRQGDVEKVLEMYAYYGGYQPAGSIALAGMSCERRVSAEARELISCRHDGGHTLSMDHLAAAWRYFEELGLL